MYHRLGNIFSASSGPSFLVLLLRSELARAELELVNLY